MPKLRSIASLLVVLALIFSAPCIFHCQTPNSSIENRTVADEEGCHHSQDDSSKPQESESKAPSSFAHCCKGMTNCCAYIVENTLDVPAVELLLQKATFFGHWQQSQGYSLPWKPPKHFA